MSTGENEASPSSNTEAPENISQPIPRARPRQSSTERHNPAPNVVSSPEPFEAPAKHPRMVAAPSRPASVEPKPFSADPQSRQFVSGSASEQKAHSEPETRDQENEQAGIRPKDDRRSVAAFVESKTPASTSPPKRTITSVGPPYPSGPGPAARKQDPPSDSKEPPGEGLERAPIQLRPGIVAPPQTGEPAPGLATAATRRHCRSWPDCAAIRPYLIRRRSAASRSQALRRHRRCCRRRSWRDRTDSG